VLPGAVSEKAYLGSSLLEAWVCPGGAAPPGIANT